VCNYHYFHDLYLYKKSQKGNTSQEAKPKKAETTKTTKKKSTPKKKTVTEPNVFLNTSTNISSLMQPPTIVGGPITTGSVTHQLISSGTVSSLLQPAGLLVTKQPKKGRKKNLRIVTSGPMALPVTANSFMQPSPVHTDDVIALINFVSQANQ